MDDRSGFYERFEQAVRDNDRGRSEELLAAHPRIAVADPAAGWQPPSVAVRADDPTAAGALDLLLIRYHTE